MQQDATVQYYTKSVLVNDCFILTYIDPMLHPALRHNFVVPSTGTVENTESYTFTQLIYKYCLYNINKLINS
jgi:hypothetical protein